jgi:hypothetical protein
MPHTNAYGEMKTLLFNHSITILLLHSLINDP